MRYNWNPIEKCAAELDSQPKSAGAGRDGPNIRYCEPTKIPGNPGKSPIQRRPGRTAAGRENPQSNADPAGPPPAGKIPKPNRLVLLLLLLLLLLSSPHGKAGSAGNHPRERTVFSTAPKHASASRTSAYPRFTMQELLLRFGGGKGRVKINPS